jgi:hypothetical protein
MLVSKALNKVTGKESTRALDFDKTNWSNATHQYMASVQGLRPSSWDSIMAAALQFTVARRGGDGSSKSSVIDIGSDDEGDIRGLLIDSSDSDMEEDW